MTSKIESVPIDQDMTCIGKPLPEESRSCVDAEGNEPAVAARSSVSKTLAGESSNEPLGFPPRALIAMANAGKLPKPQPLGFAPRALIALANAKRKP